jgi:hypothetical protein
MLLLIPDPGSHGPAALLSTQPIQRDPYPHRCGNSHTARRGFGLGLLGATHGADPATSGIDAHRDQLEVPVSRAADQQA